MLDFLPNPIAIQLGPLPVYWYGIGYAIGLAAAYLVMHRLAQRAGEDAEILGNGIIIVAVAALIGGRALPRHRPVGALPERPDQDLPAAVFRARRLRRHRDRDDRRLRLRALQAGPVPALGGHHRARPVRDAGHRALGQLLQPGAVRAADDRCRGASRSTAPTVSVAYACPPGSAPTDTLGRSSTRCSCTNRSRGRSARSCSSGSAITLRKRLRPGDLLLIFFVWYGVIRFMLEIPSGGQLDVLRRPDRADRVGAVHRRVAGDPGLAPPLRACPRRTCLAPGRCDVGRHRSAADPGGARSRRKRG